MHKAEGIGCIENYKGVASKITLATAFCALHIILPSGANGLRYWCCMFCMFNSPWMHRYYHGLRSK